jgi:hypothetical protein
MALQRLKAHALNDSHACARVVDGAAPSPSSTLLSSALLRRPPPPPLTKVTVAMLFDLLLASIGSISK